MISYFIQAHGTSPDDDYPIELEQGKGVPTYATIEEAIENLHRVYAEIFEEDNGGWVTSLTVELANSPTIHTNANPYEQPERPRGWCTCHPERWAK